MSAEQAEPISAAVAVQLAQALVVLPGDHLLIRVSPKAPAHTLELARVAIEQRLPNLAFTIIGADEFAVVRASQDGALA